MLQSTLRVPYNFSAYCIVLLICRFDVNITFAQPLYQYVPLLVHLDFYPLVYVSLCLFRFVVPHWIVETTQSYPVVANFVQN